MESVFRAAAVYLVLLVLFRLAGKRTLGKLTAFDLVLIIIIGEATQQGLLGDDFSLTNALLVVVTLLGIDITFSFIKQRSHAFDKIVDGVPVVIVDDGKLLEDRMAWSRVDANDVLTAARESQGLERVDQIKYAVLERSGAISIIPK